MKAIISCMFLMVALAGCFGPALDDGRPVNEEDPQDELCKPFYYVGCDDNPDAHYMLETFGLHQFTNSTERLARPVIHDGLIAWVRGGHGDPVWHHAVSVPGHEFFTYQTEANKVQRGVYIHSGMIFVSEHPRSPSGEFPKQENFNQSVLMLWKPEQDNFSVLGKPEDVPLVPAGFDGTWVFTTILSYGTSHRNGIAALNVESEEYIELYPIIPNDGSHFGGPLIDSTIGGGYAFLSMLWASEPGEPNAVIKVDLESGERTEILNLTGHAIQAMDASENYLVLQASMDGKSGIWAWDIQAQEWFFVQEGRERAATHPKVGGDWIVYLEHRSAEYPSVLVGYHIPTGTHHELIVGQPDPRKASPFEYVTWDTDGQHIVAHINIWSTVATSPFEFRGSQLYWMELPDVS